MCARRACSLAFIDPSGCSDSISLCNNDILFDFSSMIFSISLSLSSWLLSLWVLSSILDSKEAILDLS
uniref:Uncharacterized protein n=1 Tax=Rhizophora mucronata TaxID=61149 RepID=A0A2P2N596_RHIMU